MKKLNKKEEKLKRCKDIDLSKINIDEVDDLNEMQISRKSLKKKELQII